jgi:protein-L-isoaspartate(D-aspartate) O-methyltransferase
MDDRELRVQMVERQIARRGVRDPRVLQALRDVPRQAFVPRDQRAHAYEDRALPIASGQTISQPYIVAAMTEMLTVEAHHRVLEIGTGSGYQTAILANLAARVISFDHLGVANVEILVGDGSEGVPAAAPFDRILVTAGAPGVPEALKEQLAVGGRLVVPVGPPNHQYLTVVDRTSAGFDQHERDACVFVPLIGRQGWEA